MQRKLGRPIYAQFQRESLAIVCAYVSLALFGPLRFLALVLIPQVNLPKRVNPTVILHPAV
ncbi:hypothetical protein T492DRAFT_902692 [Pavlovales sp. CCMP2436]|nr:hypothetical protein T492DRAFT_902692 [Pavlovales sp. CCMP2436]